MNWREEWRRLSGRIDGLADSSRYLLSAPEARQGDATALSEIIGNAKDAFRDLKALWATYQRRDGAADGRWLPSWAERRLAKFISSHENYFYGSDSGFPGVATRTSLLIAIQAELDYLFADTEAFAKSLINRALAHLQRSIVADHLVAQSWREAFNEGEPRCEKLGAVQLLRFGIYAFKVDASGERTDLVFGTPLDVGEVEKTAEALVLTEWKLVRQHSELESKISEGRTQTAAYASGSLAGVELSSRRYLLMVSSEVIPQLPRELPDGAVTYEVINIAVDPSSPSKRARRRLK